MAATVGAGGGRRRRSSGWAAATWATGPRTWPSGCRSSATRPSAPPPSRRPWPPCAARSPGPGPRGLGRRRRAGAPATWPAGLADAWNGWGLHPRGAGRRPGRGAPGGRSRPAATRRRSPAPGPARCWWPPTGARPRPAWPAGGRAGRRPRLARVVAGDPETVLARLRALGRRRRRLVRGRLRGRPRGRDAGPAGARPPACPPATNWLNVKSNRTAGESRCNCRRRQSEEKPNLGVVQTNSLV